MKRTGQLHKGSSQASLILRQHCFLIKVSHQELELASCMEHFHLFIMSSVINDQKQGHMLLILMGKEDGQESTPTNAASYHLVTVLDSGVYVHIVKYENVHLHHHEIVNPSELSLP